MSDEEKKQTPEEANLTEEEQKLLDEVVGEEEPKPPIEEPEEPKVEVQEEQQELSLKEILSRPDVKEFIQKIRKQEKDKLYLEIEKRDEKIKGLETDIGSLRGKLSDSEKASFDAEKKFQDQITDLVKKMDAMELAAKKKDLELYKERALKEAGDELILALVKGDTEAEIDASIEEAKAQYQTIASKFAKEEVPVEEETPAPQKPKVPNKPSNPVVNASGKISEEDIKNMSTEDWGKQRDLIKKNMGLKK